MKQGINRYADVRSRFHVRKMNQTISSATSTMTISARSGERIRKKAGENHQLTICTASQMRISTDPESDIHSRQPATANASASANHSGVLIAGGRTRSGT